MEENEELKISQTITGQNNSIAILNLKGYIDTNTATVLKEKLLFYSSRICRYILDFGGVEYVSSAGWGVVLSRIKENREKGGDILFVNMNKDVYSIYDLLELHKVIKYYPTTGEALGYFGEKTIVKEQAPTHAPVKEEIPARVKNPPLEDTIRKIIIDNPLFNSAQIKGILELPEYGFKNLSTLKVYFTLRRMKLNKKDQKLYFAWQEARKKRG